MAKQHRSAGVGGVEQACGVSTLALLVIGGIAATACGGRTLESAPSADGAAGTGGAGTGGAATGSNGDSNDGDSSDGNGNNGNGNGNNGNGNGSNGNGGASAGNNQSSSLNTSADSTTGNPDSSVSVGGAGQSVSMVTSTNTITTGGMLGTGACDAPYDLGSAIGSFSGVTNGLGSFVSACGGAGPETFLLWTAPETGTYRINTFGSEIDTVLNQLLQSNCEGLGVVQCVDDVNGSTDSELLLYAVEGEFVTLVVDSFNTGGRYQFEIVRSDDPVEPCSPPFEVLFGVGAPLVNQALPLDDNTLNDSSTDLCNGMSPRVGFDWEAPADGTFSFDTLGSNYDTVLVLRAACNDALGRLCNDDTAGLDSQVSLLAWEGQIVRVEVAAFGGNYSTNDGAEPRITLNVRQQ